MVRLSWEKHAELERFWRFHHDEWAGGRLNQREYCEQHGLPLKRFGNWRDRFKGEAKVHKSGLLYRRGGLGHMASHMADKEIGAMSPGYIPAIRATPEIRRSFNLSDKKGIIAETETPGTSLSAVARRHGIGTRLLFRWPYKPVTRIDFDCVEASADASRPGKGSFDKTLRRGKRLPVLA